MVKFPKPTLEQQTQVEATMTTIGEMLGKLGVRYSVLVEFPLSENSGVGAQATNVSYKKAFDMAKGSFDASKQKAR